MPFLIIAAVFVAFVVVAVLVTRKAGAANARIDEALGSLEVLRKDKATFHGQLSGDERQTKAIGALALTPDELVFLQLVPEREVRIRRADITGAEITRSFREKTSSTDLMVVRWGAGDAADAAAFEVPDDAAWTADLGH